MLKIIRVIAAFFYAVLACIIGCLYCLFRPRDKRNLAICAHGLGYTLDFMGIKLKKRYPNGDKHTQPRNCIYIANHQSNFDIFVLGRIIHTGTVTIGKKSLVRIPLFGWLYWLSGNFSLDRTNRKKAHDTLTSAIEYLKTGQSSAVWIFPEGTRSRGKGLLPFKLGAFHAAIAAKVPVVLVSISQLYGEIELNRWGRKTVIAEILPPISTENYTPQQAKELALHCHAIMAKRLAAINAETAQINKKASPE